MLSRKYFLSAVASVSLLLACSSYALTVTLNGNNLINNVSMNGLSQTSSFKLSPKSLCSGVKGAVSLPFVFAYTSNENADYYLQTNGDVCQFNSSITPNGVGDPVKSQTLVCYCNGKNGFAGNGQLSFSVNHSL